MDIASAAYPREVLDLLPRDIIQKFESLDRFLDIESCTQVLSLGGYSHGEKRCQSIMMLSSLTQRR